MFKNYKWLIFMPLRFLTIIIIRKIITIIIIIALIIFVMNKVLPGLAAPLLLIEKIKSII